ncbi:hypothetical protein D3C81_1772880 [compost metagenome]
METHQAQAQPQRAEHQQGTDQQHPLQVAGDVLKQRIQQHGYQCAEEEHQVAELVHGEHRAAARRPYPIVRQHGHQRQRPAAAARRGTNGELGGHHRRQAFQSPESAGLVAQ